MGRLSAAAACMLVGLTSCAALYGSDDDDPPGFPIDPRGPQPDGGNDAGTLTPPPATQKCSRAQPFGSPMLVPGLSTVAAEGAQLSPDELTIYFSVADAAGKRDVFYASRASTGDAFGARVPVSIINTGDDETCAAISPLATEIVFARSLPNEPFNLFYASRSSAAVPFGAPSKLATLSNGGNEITPFLLRNGSAMYFTSFRSGAGDIYRAGRAGSSFDPPVLVAGIATAEWDSSPVVTDDELVVFYTSIAGDTNPNGFERFNVWTASRSSATQPFGGQQRIDVLSSPQADAPTWLSNDECRLYVQSSRTGAPRLYVAERGSGI